MNNNRCNLAERCIIMALVSLCFKLTAVGVPNDPIVSDYLHIEQKNPFKLLIEKKVIEQLTPQVKKLDRYFLRGVTELSSGWLVVIAEIANPKTSIMLRSDQPAAGKPSIINVVTNKLDYRKTEVELSINGEKQIVRYHSSSQTEVAPAVNRSKIVKPKPVTQFIEIVEPEKTRTTEIPPDAGKKENNVSGSSPALQRTRPKFNQQ